MPSTSQSLQASTLIWSQCKSSAQNHNTTADYQVSTLADGAHPQSAAVALERG